MLCYTRIDALEGFEVNKSNKSKECICRIRKNMKEYAIIGIF